VKFGSRGCAESRVEVGIEGRGLIFGDEIGPLYICVVYVDKKQNDIWHILNAFMKLAITSHFDPTHEILL